MLFSWICFCSPSKLNLLYSWNIVKWKTCDIILCYELISLCTGIILTFVFFIKFNNIINNEKIFRNFLCPNIYNGSHHTLLCRHVCDFRFFSLQQSFKKLVINIKQNQTSWKSVKIHIMISDPACLYDKLFRIILLIRTILSGDLW